MGGALARIAWVHKVHAQTPHVCSMSSPPCPHTLSVVLGKTKNCPLAHPCVPRTPYARSMFVCHDFLFWVFWGIHHSLRSSGVRVTCVPPAAALLHRCMFGRESVVFGGLAAGNPGNPYVQVCLLHFSESAREFWWVHFGEPMNHSRE